MAITIKYTGTQTRWPELAVTGKQSVWNPGQIESRDDAEARLLLSTGVFTAENDTFLTLDASTGLQSGGAALSAEQKSKTLTGIGARPVRTHGAMASIGRTAAMPTANCTYLITRTAAAPFHAVRARVANIETGSDTVTIGMTAAAHNTLVDGANNAPSGTLTAMAFRGSAGVTVPAAASANRPRYDVTDWLPLESVPRVDVPGGLPVVQVRHYQNAIPHGGRAAASFWGTSDPLLGGHMEISRRFNGQNYLTNGAAFTGTTYLNHTPIFDIEFLYDVPCITLACFGDSLTDAGSLPVRPYLSHFHRAAFSLSTQARPVQVRSFGWGGSTTAQTYARARDYLLAKDADGIYINDPTILTFPIASSNDGVPTQEIISANRLMVFDLANICAQRGIVFCPQSMVPTTNSANTVASLTAGQLTLRRDFNAECMSREDAFYLPMDVASVAELSGNPGFWAAAGTLDGVHPSDDMTTEMAAPVSSAIFKLL